jgi:hypothetical protein
MPNARQVHLVGHRNGRTLHVLGSIRPEILFTKWLRYHYSAMHIFRGIRCCIFLSRSGLPPFGSQRRGLMIGRLSRFISVATKYILDKGRVI